MISGMTLFTFIHVMLSLIAIAAGVVVVAGLLASKPLPIWTGLFLLTTALTSATGFGFRTTQFLPAHGVGIVSLIVLPVVLFARYAKQLAGAWRWIYAVGAVLSLHLNVLVLVAQVFRRVPALHALAPTESEPPFIITQLGVLALFAALALVAAKRFHPEATKTVRPVGAAAH